MLTEKSEIWNFKDTSYKSSPSLLVVLNCFEHDITIVLNWFKVNSLKANPQNVNLSFLGGEKSFQYKFKLRTTIFFQKIK